MVSGESFSVHPMRERNVGVRFFDIVEFEGFMMTLEIVGAPQLFTDGLWIGWPLRSSRCTQMLFPFG